MYTLLFMWSFPFLCLSSNDIVLFSVALLNWHERHAMLALGRRGNLCSHVKQKRRLPEPEARQIFVQLLAGLEYMHNNGVIHRDVKVWFGLLSYSEFLRCSGCYDSAIPVITVFVFFGCFPRCNTPIWYVFSYDMDQKRARAY